MSWGQENLIFLVSLPRSGSTLLQRILSSHIDVESTSETWLLLPQVYALREGASFAEYSHTTASRAINDFADCLPGGKKDYLGVVAKGFLQQTENVNVRNSRYFLEKTPRNNLILPEIVAMFPRAKYVFLWRNPAAIAASMIESFAQGKWNLYHHSIDLEVGLQNMLNANEFSIQNRIDLKYENLISQPEIVLEGLFSFLGLDFSPEVIEAFKNTNLKGRMGDPTGVKMYDKVSKEPLGKWLNTFSNPIRKRWLRTYIKSINADKLKAVGYDVFEILSELNNTKTTLAHMFGDAIRMLYGYIDRKYHISIIRIQLAAKLKTAPHRLQ